MIKVNGSGGRDDACRSLVSAVMLEAVKDYRQDFRKPMDDYTLKLRKRDQAEAETWIFGMSIRDGSRRFTFSDCCEHLGLEENNVRQKLKEREQKLVDFEVEKLWKELGLDVEDKS